MSAFNKETYDKLVQSFLNATKCVLKENISTNQNTLKSYEVNLVKTFNELASYIDVRYDDFNKQEQDQLENIFNSYRKKLVESFKKLEGEIILPKDVFHAVERCFSCKRKRHRIGK